MAQMWLIDQALEAGIERAVLPRADTVRMSKINIVKRCASNMCP